MNEDELRTKDRALERYLQSKGEYSDDPNSKTRTTSLEGALRILSNEDPEEVLSAEWENSRLRIRYGDVEEARDNVDMSLFLSDPREVRSSAATEPGTFYQPVGLEKGVEKARNLEREIEKLSYSASTKLFEVFYDD